MFMVVCMNNRIVWLCRSLVVCCLLVLVGAQSGCIQGIIADEMLKAPNPEATDFTIKVKSGEDVSSIIPFLFDDVGVIEVGPPKALMTYFVVEPKPNFYYVHADYTLHSDKEWQDQVAKDVDGPLATNSRTIETDYLPYQLCLAISHPAINDQALAKRISKPLGTVILLQGHSGYVRKEPYLWPLAAVLSNHGYRVIMPDLRGQGDSSGDCISYGKYEANDLKQLVDELQRKHLIAGKLGMMGHSYGSMMSLFAAANDSRISAVISISPHNRMGDPAAAMNIAKVFHPSIYETLGALGGEDLLREGIGVAADRLGVNEQEAAPSVAIQKTKVSVLLMQGEQDQICPVYASKQILDARPKNTERVIYPKSDHWMLLYNQDLWQRVVTFFDKNLTHKKPRTQSVSGLHYKAVSKH